MTSTNFQLNIVSADQRLPKQTVDVNSEWTTADLKKHLSEVYPGEPPVDSQKLIFAGRILSDDSVLQNIIGQESISKTVHLVLPPSVANQVKAAVDDQQYSGFTPEQIDTLKKEYLQYLNNYYADGTTPFSNPVNDRMSDDEDIINVEIDINEDVRVPENGFQRLLRIFGFGGVNDNVADQEQAFGALEEQVDLFDLAYAVFRISILVTICVAYANWERIVLVAVVGLIFYWCVGISNYYYYIFSFV